MRLSGAGWACHAESDFERGMKRVLELQAARSLCSSRLRPDQRHNKMPRILSEVRMRGELSAWVRESKIVIDTEPGAGAVLSS